MKHLATIQNEFLKLSQEDDMSGTVHEEREARITLSELPEEVKGNESTLIKQGVLREVRDDNDKMISYARIRMKQEPGEDAKYSLGVKNFPLHQEAETEISKEMFDSFFPDNLLKPQVKHRYMTDSGWEIDEVDTDGGIYAEFEHEKGDKVKMPSHWKRIK